MSALPKSTRPIPLLCKCTSNQWQSTPLKFKRVDKWPTAGYPWDWMNSHQETDYLSRTLFSTKMDPRRASRLPCSIYFTNEKKQAVVCMGKAWVLPAPGQQQENVHNKYCKQPLPGLHLGRIHLVGGSTAQAKRDVVTLKKRSHLNSEVGKEH